jgi:hypothetical protein
MIFRAMIDKALGRVDRQFCAILGAGAGTLLNDVAPNDVADDIRLEWARAPLNRANAPRQSTICLAGRAVKRLDGRALAS